MSNSKSSRQVFLLGATQKALAFPTVFPTIHMASIYYLMYFIHLLPIFLLYRISGDLCELVKSDCLHPSRRLPTELQSQVPLLRDD